MIVVQCTALGLLIVRYAFATMYVTITCVAFHHQRTATKFSKVSAVCLCLIIHHYSVLLLFVCPFSGRGPRHLDIHATLSGTQVF